MPDKRKYDEVQSHETDGQQGSERGSLDDDLTSLDEGGEMHSPKRRAKESGSDDDESIKLIGRRLATVTAVVAEARKTAEKEAQTEAVVTKAEEDAAMQPAAATTAPETAATAEPEPQPDSVVAEAAREPEATTAQTESQPMTAKADPDAEPVTSKAEPEREKEQSATEETDPQPQEQQLDPPQSAVAPPAPLHSSVADSSAALSPAGPISAVEPAPLSVAVAAALPPVPEPVVEAMPQVSAMFESRPSAASESQAYESAAAESQASVPSDLQPPKPATTAVESEASAKSESQPPPPAEAQENVVKDCGSKEEAPRESDAMDVDEGEAKPEGYVVGADRPQPEVLNSIEDAPFTLEEQMRFQWFFSMEDMEYTPSIEKGGYTVDEERIKRAENINYLLRMIEYLRITAPVASTAVTYFHRFYMRESMPPKDAAREAQHRFFKPNRVAAACIFLAVKAVDVDVQKGRLVRVVEAAMAAANSERSDHDRKVFLTRDYARLHGRARRNRHGEIHDHRMVIDEKDLEPAHRTEAGYAPIRWKERILETETILAKTLCFDFIVPMPLTDLVYGLKNLRVDRKVFAASWMIMTDCYRGPLYIATWPNILAAACFQWACELIGATPQEYAVKRAEELRAGEIEMWFRYFDIPDQPSEEEELAQAMEELAKMYRLLDHMSAKIPEEIQKNFLKHQQLLIEYHNPHLKRKAPPPLAPAATRPAQPTGSQWGSFPALDSDAPPPRSYAGSTLLSPTMPSAPATDRGPAASSMANIAGPSRTDGALPHHEERSYGGFVGSIQRVGRREERSEPGFVGSIHRVDPPSEAAESIKNDRREYRAQRRAGQYDPDETVRMPAKPSGTAVPIEYFATSTNEDSSQRRAIKIKRRNADDEATSDDEDWQPVSRERRAERDTEQRSTRGAGEGGSDSRNANPRYSAVSETPSRSTGFQMPPIGGGSTSLHVTWEPPLGLVEPGSFDRAEWDAIDGITGLLPPELQPLKTTRIHDITLAPSNMTVPRARAQFCSKYGFINFHSAEDAHMTMQNAKAVHLQLRNSSKVYPELSKGKSNTLFVAFKPMLLFDDKGPLQQELGDMFAQFGRVADVDVRCEASWDSPAPTRVGGQGPLVACYFDLATPAAAQAAIEILRGRNFRNVRLSVSHATGRRSRH